jgi:hypothetical protein
MPVAAGQARRSPGIELERRNLSVFSRTSALVIALVALSPAALAQQKPFGGYPSADMEYCARLAEIYIRYVGRSETGPRTPVTPDGVGGTALAQCKEQDKVALAIPVLERKLLDARFTLPPRN